MLNDTRFIGFARATLVVLMVYLGILALSTLKSISFIGSGVTASNTISISGHGEVFAKPDTAEFTATMMETAKDVVSAQSAAAKDANAVTDYLAGAGVDAKDIQTTDYEISPQYSYQQSACPQPAVYSADSGAVGAPAVYCPPGRQTLTGYEVSETLDIKVRDTGKAGELLSGVGQKGASQVSALTFTIADQDSVDAQARDKAITDAKTKAQALAGSLGVSLVRIVGFSEGSEPTPFAPRALSMSAVSASAPVAPDISTGQNTITSDVTLTYEIE